jgi:hypothetical protein
MENNQFSIHYRIFKNETVIYSENLLEKNATRAIDKIAGKVVRILSDNEGKEITIAE